MKTNRFLFAMLSVVALFTASFMTSCTENEAEDLGSPSLELSTATLTFDAAGEPTDSFGGTVEVTSNRDWVVAIPTAEQDWLSASVASGKGNGAVTFTLAAADESRSAKVSIQVRNDWGVAVEKTVTVAQGEGAVGGATGDVIFYEPVGTTTVQKDGDYYPYVTAYTDWATTGVGASTVTFNGENATVRSSGLASTGYEGASGINNVFFGAAASFTIEKITLTAEQTDLNFTFGGSRYIYASKDNTFVPESLTVSLSADGSAWTPITYKVNKVEGESWVLCESNFTLKEATSSLYIKFTCSEASVIRTDDFKLSEGTGGAVVDLGEGGTVTPPDPGTDPEVDDTDAIYYEPVGTDPVQKEGNYYPYVSDYTAWAKEGTGSSTVTYSGEETSVRTTSSHTSAGYDSASGVNSIFFAKVPATFTIEKISLTDSQKDLHLSFGGNRFIYDTKDNTFIPENLVVSLSADGETWSTISYAANKTSDESWVYCESNFTLKEATSSLYIKFTCSEASVIRVDDFKLTEGKGGDIVDLGEGTTTTPDPGTDPEVKPEIEGDYLFDYEALGTTWLNATEKTLGGVDWYIDGMKNSGDKGNIGFSYYNEVGGSCYNKTAFGTGVTEVIVDHKSGEALTVYAGASENPTAEVTPTVEGTIYTYAISGSCPFVAFKNNSTAYINLNSLVINYEGTIGEGGTTTPDPGTDPEVKPEGDNDGSKEKPFTLEEAKANQDTNDVWVKATIIGTAAGGTSLNAEGKDVATNLAIGVDADNFMPVQLPATDVRTALNLVDNPGNLGREVLLHGDLMAYYGAPGLKNVDDFYFTDGQGGGTVTPDVEVEGDYVFDYESLGSSWLNATEKTLGGVNWYIDGMKNSGSYGNIGFSYYNEIGGSCYNKTAFGTGVTEVVVDIKSGDALTVYAGASENPAAEVTPTVEGTIYTYTISGSCPFVAFKNNSTAYINLNSLVINYEGTIE